MKTTALLPSPLLPRREEREKSMDPGRTAEMHPGGWRRLPIPVHFDVLGLRSQSFC
jgi:hypothetical protein